MEEKRGVLNRYRSGRQAKPIQVSFLTLWLMKMDRVPVSVEDNSRVNNIPAEKTTGNSRSPLLGIYPFFYHHPLTSLTFHWTPFT